MVSFSGIGRPYSMSLDKVERVLGLYWTSGLSIRKISNIVDVPYSTVWRIVNTLISDAVAGRILNIKEASVWQEK